MRSISELSPQAREVAIALAEIARRGPIQAVGHGDKAVGVTLMNELGMEHSVTSKPRYNGLVITARRGSRESLANRVNLFAKVPDWDVSACKSSREIVDRYGYDRDGGRKLYCTIRARQPNAQGLYLAVDREKGLLRERSAQAPRGFEEVAAWRLSTLRERLLASHPESAWVIAKSSKRDGKEYFHYRYVHFTSEPLADQLPRLLEMGTVTVDHLIFSDARGTTDKGPLFKIAPGNVSALFPASPTFDLMHL